jgi:hypothetical protein
MPVGRIAAMKPEPLALTSFGSRIGSPAMKGARAIEPAISLIASALVAADETVAGGRGRPGLPLQILGLDRLAEADVGFRDENVHGLQLRDRRRGAGFVVGSAREICGNAAGTESDGQDDNACGIHTLRPPFAAPASARC